MNISKNREYLKLLHNLRQTIKEDSTKNFRDYSEIDFEVYKELVNLFYKRNNRYPTAVEFNASNLLPSARFIQRRYGGLKKFRESIGLEITNYTTGDTHVQKVKEILKRAKDYEQELYILLYRKFHNPDKGVIVAREPVISGYDPENDSYGYKRADVAIYNYLSTPKKTTFIDFFYASTKENLYGCVNIKNKKIKNLIPLEDIIYVSLNPNFSKEDIDSFTLPKESPQIFSKEEFITEYLK